MSRRRIVRVLLGLAVAGVILGALAGAVVVTATLFVLGVRHGRFELPMSWFVTSLGAGVGGIFGAILAPMVAFTPWRNVPVGRLFAQLTVGTMIGGIVVALLLPAFVLVGGILGFLVAGDRLASRYARTSQRA